MSAVQSPDPSEQISPPQTSMLGSTAGVIAVAIAALYFGRDIFIPLGLSVLLVFILTPLTNWLRRIGIPRIAAIAVVVTMSFAAIGGVAVAVGFQLVQLAENLPEYQRNVSQKLAALRGSAPGGGLVANVSETLRDLRRELTKSSPGAKPDTSGPARPEPIAVVIEPTPMQPLELLQTVVSPLLGPLGTAALVVLFVIFIMLEREELRDRFIKLVGNGDLQRSTEAITEAGARVSRYLLMQLIVNVTYGFPIGVGLAIIGVPNAILWGVLAAVLRFIPYIGPWIAAVFPLTIAFGVDPGWSMLLWTIALFLVIELISNNAVEPWLYGSSTGLSSFAIILAAIFWTLLWGPVGLFLSTPLTVCLVVIGRYVPRLEFIGVLLGSEPVLTPAEKFYQRLLSNNVAEAVDMAEQCIDEHTAKAFYEEIALSALRLAENDRERNLDVGFRRRIADASVAVVKELDDIVEEKRQGAIGNGKPVVAVAASQSAPARIVVIGGETELDAAAAELLALTLGEAGLPTRTLPPLSLSRAAIDQLDLDRAEAVCLSFLGSDPRVPARYICRRLGRRWPHVAIIVCFWNSESAAQNAASLVEGLGSRASIATTLGDAEKSARAALIRGKVASPEAESEIKAQRSKEDTAFVEALIASGLTGGKGERFSTIAGRITEELGYPVTLIVADLGANDAGDELDRPSDRLLLGAVMDRAEPIAVPDISKDARFANDKDLLEKGVRSMLVAPIRAPSGAVVGAVCALDGEQRDISRQDLEKLAAIATSIE